MNQQNKAPWGPKDPWSVVCLAAAVVLWGNFLLCLGLAVGAVGYLLVEVSFAVSTALLLLLGIVLYLLGKRQGAGKLWRRLLLGSLFANGLVIVFYIAALGALFWYAAQF